MARTLALIKPGTAQEHAARIVEMIQNNGFKILSMRAISLTSKQAAEFYREHRGKPFFKPLCEYMCSEPIIALILEHKEAVKKWRRLMGATDPKMAEPSTIRHMFGQGNELPKNVVHGSDNEEAARREISIIFNGVSVNIRQD